MWGLQTLRIFSGLNGSTYKSFFDAIYSVILSKEKSNKTSVEKLASNFGITDKNIIKEITETAIVSIARKIANQPNKTVKQKYDEIVDLYKSQVNLSHRTSQSMLLQQYSTPATIGYLMGVYCKIDQPGNYYEPSAGNGMLTIANSGNDFTVNEIDAIRFKNLEFQDVFKIITKTDSSKETYKSKYFDAVVTNPPFATVNKDEYLILGEYQIKHLDHKMAILALNSMKDNGKAAIIVGGHTNWDSKGRIQAGKNRIFLSYLYKNYNVEDIILIDGNALYSKMGTGFDTRIILINGRKAKPEGFAPLKNDVLANVIKTTDDLFDRFSKHFEKKSNTNSNKMTAIRLRAKAALLKQKQSGLKMPYLPASESCFSLQVDTPDSMSFEIHNAIKKIKAAVGGSLNEYLVKKLQYANDTALCKALAAEQIDGVATAVYNIEYKDQGIIIGDQTGIGKGRQAAAIVRYAKVNGYLPIFITEKPNLFTDLYRDLEDIGNGNYIPFIVNAKDSKTDIKNNAGEIIAQAPPKAIQDAAFKKGVVPSGYDFVVGTYSQFASAQPTIKQSWLRNITDKKTIIIMDESHNASGSSATGAFLKEIVSRSKSTIFLSATFAKRPDNMPIYALKTSIQDANMSDEDLVNAITNGGVALQEVLAAQLVQEGQMIRRERTYEGIQINYITLDKLAKEHGQIADDITEIIRDLISFQAKHIDAMVEDLDKIAAAENSQVEKTQGTQNAGVDNSSYFSRVFNIINQMLFAIKADEVANLAIQRLKEGMKPVIAFSNTMGAFVEELDIDAVVDADFKEVLRRGLDTVLSYTTKDDAGNSEKSYFSVDEMGQDAREDYYKILAKIEKVSTGIVISPIDHIVQKIEKAGYKTAEVTGRKKEIQLSYTKNGVVGEIQNRKKINANDAFRQFNNNEVDVLLINQSGSTGASAHAITTKKIPASEVKQRVMIVLQAELNINTEVQKRGRINRTGQILKPQYDYVASAIPAELRLQMMLQKKMKSLDANTTSNQKNSEDLLKSEDFLNKYGDEIVKTWLEENPEMNRLLGNLITEDTKDFSNLAHKTSGRVAILPIKQQESFYKTILDQYHTEVARLIQSGDYDLELESMNLEAVTLDKMVVVVGKNTNSVFGGNTYLEKCEINNLSKPYSKTEILKMLNAAEFDNADEKQNRMVAMYDQYVEGEISKIFLNKTEKWTNVSAKIIKEKGYKESLDQENYLIERKNEIEVAKQEDIDQATSKFKNQSDVVRRFLRFFKVGKGVKVPIVSFDNGSGTADGIVLDVSFNQNADNPFTPSNINFSIAVSNSERRKDLKASGKFQIDLNAIIGASYYINSSSSERILENWDETARESNVNRRINYIVTGNILQGYSKYDKGKLVSYTLKDGGVKKGILLPANWRPSTTSGSSDNYVNVPIFKALNFIRSSGYGAVIRTNTGLSLQKQSDEFRIYVPGSRKQGGSIYLDEKIINLTTTRNFDKIGSQMSAYVSMDNLPEFLRILENDHSVSALVMQSRIGEIKEVAEAIETATQLETKNTSGKGKVLRLRAKAISIKQKQLLIAI